MKNLDPAAIAAKWSARAQAATEDYKSGVQNVQGAPGAKAAAKADKWLANVQGAKAKFASRVGSVGEAEWKQATVEKGGARYAGGVQSATPKMAGFMSEFLPHLTAVTNRVNAMPDTTLEQRLTKMVEQARGTSQFKRGGRG